jgi:hypothetical protein
MKRTHGDISEAAGDQQSENTNMNIGSVKSHQPKISRKIRACEYRIFSGPSNPLRSSQFRVCLQSCFGQHPVQHHRVSTVEATPNLHNSLDLITALLFVNPEMHSLTWDKAKSAKAARLSAALSLEMQYAQDVKS